MRQPKFFSFFKFIIFILILALAIGLFAYFWNINSPAGSVKQVEFTVTPGDSVKIIGGKLLAAGLIKSEFFFEVYVWQAKKGSSFQAGTYELSPTMTVKQIVLQLAAGETISREREITIIPGWTLRDIAAYLAQEHLASSTEFYQLAGEPLKDYAKAKAADLPFDFSADFSILADKPKNFGLEGYLFPDTYRIFSDATARDIIEKMLSNLDGKLDPALRQEINRQHKTIYEIITMASIIEKEVKTEADMKIVSDIFWGRLAAGQALGSDATLSYALGENKAAHTLAETKINSPYNTYRFAGLPPGPICNPSLVAIKAAIYPTPTDDNYFLTRPDTGETVFAKTLEEQNYNKQKYLK
ncbi:MAG TPA: endolytic transglycosylase MltG [Candidatus Methylomirabilis sp.]|nr:endolytic transglycosylase MltG [Candidatus Methylomirabilis sp.]